jgi:osmotically-inducible protein OsmY
MRTDRQIQQDVIAELQWEPSVNATHIGVEVNNSVVTLAGHVGSHAEKWDAERAAQRVAGVTALAVEMDVKLAFGDERTDADIANAATLALQWSTYLPKGKVRVMVEKGWLTLSGTLDWEYQRQNAEGAVRYLMGVTGISNLIAVKPTVSISAVNADIEAALKRRATADAQKISVDILGTDVTLTGTVQSWGERDTVRNSAWGTPGVHSVVDKMSIAG